MVLNAAERQDRSLFQCLAFAETYRTRLWCPPSARAVPACATTTPATSSGANRATASRTNRLGLMLPPPGTRWPEVGTAIVLTNKPGVEPSIRILRTGDASGGENSPRVLVGGPARVRERSCRCPTRS